MSPMWMVFARIPLHVLLVALATLALRSSPASAEADALFARATLAARERGGSGDPLTERRGELKAGDPVRVTIALSPRECIIAAAAIDGSSDLELSLKTPEGLSLADSEVGSLARLRYCAGSAEEKPTIRVQSAARSPFALGIWLVQPHGVQGATKVPSAPAAPVEPVAPKPATLPEQLAALARTAASDLEPMTPPREEELGEGDPRQRDVALEQERCYRVLAVSDGSIAQLSLSLADPSGAKLQAQEGEAPQVVLAAGEPVCPKQTGLYSIGIGVKGGSGHVLWQIYGKPNPALASRWAVGGSGSTLVEKRIRSVHDQRDATKPAASPFFSGELKTADEAVATFDVRPGTCYVALAAGVPSLRSLDLELLDQRGNVLVSAKDQGGSARVSACADLSARWTVRVRAFKGYGAYGVQVFSGL